MATKSKKVEQGNATRAALMNAASYLFGLNGYADTSLENIVKKAGLTKGAFYHHFTGKEEIFLHVYEMVKQELSRATFVVHKDYKPSIGDDAASEQESPLLKMTHQTNEEVWQLLLDRCSKYIERHTDPQVRRIVLIDARSVLKWEDWHAIENKYGVVILRANLRRAMNRGIIKKLPLEMLAAMLTGTLNEGCLLVANADDTQKALEEANLIVRQFLEGIRT